MALAIEKIDHEDPAVKERLRGFLAPHEPHAMFILGNLRTNRKTDLYVAGNNGQWAGVCGYYGTFKSLIPFSTDQQVVRELVNHMASIHPEINWLNGIDYMAAPAYEQLLSLGYRPGNDPHQVFMELEGQPPPQAGESLCRLFRDDDAEQTVRVLRAMDPEKEPDAPVTQEELCQIRLNPDRWVLVQDDQVVSTAATSGMGIRACQIIGLATDAGYRRRGYASAVCAHLIRAMANRGARSSLLFTGHENFAAQRCYHGLGFRITGKYYVAKLTPPG